MIAGELCTIGSLINGTSTNKFGIALQNETYKKLLKKNVLDSFFCSKTSNFPTII